MISHIQIKATHKEALVSVDQLRFSPGGISGGVECNPLRQVLILPSSVLKEFSLAPGALRENLDVDYDGLHDLPSGTVIQLGAARVRLTFHCEPCIRIKGKVALSRIQHKRGYLGQFLNTGTIYPGDQVQDLGVEFEAIPYSIKDRLEWFLSRQASPLPVTQVLFECGLGRYYARVMPNMLSRLPEELRGKVVFKGKGRQK